MSPRGKRPAELAPGRGLAIRGNAGVHCSEVDTGELSTFPQPNRRIDGGIGDARLTGEASCGRVATEGWANGESRLMSATVRLLFSLIRDAVEASKACRGLPASGTLDARSSPHPDSGGPLPQTSFQVTQPSTCRLWKGRAVAGQLSTMASEGTGSGIHIARM